MRTAKKQQTSDQATANHPMRQSSRIIVSILILFHFVSVILWPFYLQTLTPDGFASPLVRSLYDLDRQYIQAAFLNHGYAFFAPNPPEASTLIKYRLEFDDGRPPIEGKFPDLDVHWPRLLYHRHFMLAEQLNAGYVPPEPPPGANAEQIRNWQRSRKEYEAKWRSFENHLRSKYGAHRVELIRIGHVVPPPVIPPGGINLRDPNMFIELSEEAMPEPLFPDGPRREVGP